MEKSIEERIAELEKGGASEAKVRETNEQIWEEYEKAVTPENFAIATKYSSTLEGIAKTSGIRGETMARILLAKSRLTYYRDKKAGVQSDEAYKIAMEGLKYAEEVGTKVSLYNVASDTMGELVKNYERSVELADKSCEIAKTSSNVDWGKAENNTALRYLNLAKRFDSAGEKEKAKVAYNNAVVHFQNARDAHQKAGNNRQIGHAFNNLILCHQGLAGLASHYNEAVEMCDVALRHAEMAKKAYGDDPANALHAISASYRKGQTFELKAKITGLSEYLFNAIQCYEENAARALELEKPEKTKQELDNIRKIVQRRIE